MELGAALLAVGAGDRAASCDLFSETLDPEWIAQALAATGTATVRRRKPPAEHVVWLVIGMALFRDRSIREVVRHLDLVLPGLRGRRAVSGSAIAQAAAVWGPAAAEAGRWRGLAIYGVDGTTLRVPDTLENEAAFGRVPARWESTGGYPVLRAVALMVLRGHVLTGLALGAYRDSERGLAATLWPHLPDASLVILDRGFWAYWLTRARTGPLALRRRVVERFGLGDQLAELTPSPAASSAMAPATCLLCSASGRFTSSGAAFAPEFSSPRCSTPWPTPRRSSSPSTMNAGSSSWASTK